MNALQVFEPETKMTEQKRKAVRKQMNDDNSRAARRAARNKHTRETFDRAMAVGCAAREHLGFDTLETRNSDSLDFREVAVWAVKAALEAAYEAGRKSAQK